MQISSIPACHALLPNQADTFVLRQYNVPNTPSFNSPNATGNLATGGQVTSTRNQPRLFEFGLKLGF